MRSRRRKFTPQFKARVVLEVLTGAKRPAQACRGYGNEDYIALLEEHHVQISMAAQGNPQENGYAERLIRTIKEEEVDLSEYNDFADALAQIGHFIEEVYRRKRIHSALGYLTPEEFEVAWWQGQAQAEEAFSLKPAEKVSNFRGPLQTPNT